MPSAFSGLIPTLSGQTLSSLDNLSKTGFDGLNSFNGGVVTGPVTGGNASGPSGGGGDPSQQVGAVSGGGGGTPSKADYSDWGTGSTSGSAPGSGNKNSLAAGAGIERGDPTSVRRNINQNQMWPKNWEE